MTTVSFQLKCDHEWVHRILGYKKLKYEAWLYFHHSAISPLYYHGRYRYTEHVLWKLQQADCTAYELPSSYKSLRMPKVRWLVQLSYVLNVYMIRTVYRIMTIAMSTIMRNVMSEHFGLYLGERVSDCHHISKTTLSEVKHRIQV